MKDTSERGELMQVQGGHILGSTPAAARKVDRHSKVHTSKGPRDRRVRLSAYTAIQFYDVQDRLGYDRPSKAMDWLISKAKNAIEKLNESHSSDNNDNSNDYVQTTTPGSNSNPSSAPVDHLSMARGSETPPFYQLDNSHLVNNPANYYPGFSGEAPAPAAPSDLGLSLYTLQPDNNQGNSDHHHPTNLFEEYYMGSKVGFVMNSQEICQQPSVYFQGLPLSTGAIDQQNYHLQPGGRQSWYIPATFYNDEETEAHS